MESQIHVENSKPKKVCKPSSDEVFKSILNLLPFKVPNTKSSDNTEVITVPKSIKCVQDIYVDTSKILPDEQNVPINSVNISTSNLRAFRKKSQVFKENRLEASESQDPNNDHEGPKYQNWYKIRI